MLETNMRSVVTGETGIRLSGFECMVCMERDV